jgi:eukaryotic translation initiation factor 2C
VNAFPVKVTDGIIYHYDIDIANAKLPSRANLELFDRLQSQIAPTIFHKPAVYDARKNAYTTYKLQLGPTDSAQFDVPVGDTAPAGGRPPKIYRIKVTKVAEINTEFLHRFIAGQQSQDNAVSTALMAFNVALRMSPNLKYPFNVRSFFTSIGKKSTRGGLELWRGYFQSLRPSQNKLYVNVDIATGVMYKPGQLINLCLEFLGQNDVSALARLTERQRAQLQRFLANVRVVTKYGSKRPLTIKKVTPEGASKITFTMRETNQVINIAQYFKKAHNYTLVHPNIVCVEVGSGGAKLPLEICEVIPGQIMRKQISPEVTADMVDFSKLAPKERLESIKQGLQVLEYGQSAYIREFGMDISPNPLTVRARVLPPPSLTYGKGSKELDISPRDGAWNMRDKKFYKPAPIRKWVVIIYERQARFRQDIATEMVQSFIQGAQSVGMTVEDKAPLVFWRDPFQEVAAHLKDAGKECIAKTKEPPGLIVVVLPEGGNAIYDQVKNFGDIFMGVTTQCLKASKCSRAKPQYWANVMLKVNVKMGGINSVLKNSPIADPHNPTIVMGADVIHPAPGADGRPSFATVVCSVDSAAAKYVERSSVQAGRQEIIEDLEAMTSYVLTKHLGYRRQQEKLTSPPTRLIFYRDGVSEGQFAHVLEQELPMIKSACAAVKINPKITLIVVGKRHHIRMFPQNDRDGDRSGNCPAGTTIDDGLGHPTEFDYYQLSHGGLLGTSRPAHYSVIYDENKFTADAMQNLSFSMCHTYARATRSVSIPAPVYYADIVCSRAKHHYAAGMDFDDVTMGSHATSLLETFRRNYRPLHANMQNNMYFM